MTTAVNQALAPPVDGWLARISQIVCPPRCLVCREAGHKGRDLCATCAAALPWNLHACRTCALPLPDGSTDDSAICGACLQRPPPLTATHAAFVYGFPVDRLLPRFKFHGDLASGRLLVQQMVDAFGGLARPDALIPVPLHRARLRSRGYDQALELARPLGRTLGIPMLDRVLQRQRPTAPQSRLDAAQRRRNLRGAFTTTQTGALPNHVVLIDDVMTTGATLHAAATVLRRAGVQRIDAWVCARAP